MIYIKKNLFSVKNFNFCISILNNWKRKKKLTLNSTNNLFKNVSVSDLVQMCLIRKISWPNKATQSNETFGQAFFKTLV